MTNEDRILTRVVDFNARHPTDSEWLFHCRLGLRQGLCGRYSRDPESRGARQGYQGCASCEYRAGANNATRDAEIG